MKEFIAISKIGIEVVNTVQEDDKTIKDYFLADEVSDGYHTMDELYKHRMALNVALCHSILAVVGINPAIGKEINCHKAKFHHDGTMFEGGYFIVMIIFRDQQISYHYKLEHWDKFRIPEREYCLFPYDGHTSQDVIERLLKL